MIARNDGLVFLVSGAIPGERVLARVERTARGVAYADTIAVEEASVDRRLPDADPLCGGCLYRHISYARQLVIKAEVIDDAFARIGHITLPTPVIVAPSPDEGYRMRARLHVRGGSAGFFREGTHDLCPARITRQLRPDTCEVIEQLTAGLRSLGSTHVRELDVSENIDASQRVVHLETLQLLRPRDFSGLRSTGGLTGLTLAAAGGSTAATIAGSPHVSDSFELDGVPLTLRRHVLAFFQGNRFLLPALVAEVITHVSRGDRVIDLYAGAGLFSIAVAMVRGATVTAIEGDRTGAADLAWNASAAAGRVAASHQSVEAFVSGAPASPSVLIVDPPRTGMSRDALQGAIRLKASRIVYVSCDVATLARDARRFIDAGYALDTLKAFDLFPNTPHVESVVTFHR
jgi:23S rRNA (uracil1939-C5)-methyltransferase